MVNKKFFLRALQRVDENKKSYSEKAAETRQHSVRLIEMQKYVDSSLEKRRLLLETLKSPCPDNEDETVLHRGAIVFVSLLDIMDIIKQDLEKEGIKVFVINGDTKTEKRGEICHKAKEDPENTVVLLSLAGAESLNINFTNQLIVYSIGGVSSYARFIQLTGRITRMSGKYTPENGYKYYIHYVLVEETADPYFKVLLSSRKELEEDVLHADYIPLKDNLKSFNLQVIKKLRQKMLWKVKHKKG